MKFLNKFAIILLISVFLNSCGGGFKLPKPGDARTIPSDGRERARKNIEEGRGFRIMGGDKGRNTYEFASSNPLWQATLDTLDFMPLVSANYSGGIVVTDWYSENNSPNESVKISVRFLTNEIRSDALDINVFLKKCTQNLTNCSISKNNNDLISDLNFSILKKATKYEKEMLAKRRKENPYEIGDWKQGDSREDKKESD